VDGRLEAEPGEELPEEDRIIVRAAGKTGEFGSLWHTHADTNRRSMMTDRRGRAARWTRRGRTARRPSIRRIAGAISFRIVFSCPSRIPIEPGRWLQRSRAEALLGQGRERRFQVISREIT